MLNLIELAAKANKENKKVVSNKDISTKKNISNDLDLYSALKMATLLSEDLEYLPYTGYISIKITKENIHIQALKGMEMFMSITIKNKHKSDEGEYFVHYKDIKQALLEFGKNNDTGLKPRQILMRHGKLVLDAGPGYVGFREVSLLNSDLGKTKKEEKLYKEVKDTFKKDVVKDRFYKTYKTEPILSINSNILLEGIQYTKTFVPKRSEMVTLQGVALKLLNKDNKIRFMGTDSIVGNLFTTSKVKLNEFKGKGLDDTIIIDYDGMQYLSKILKYLKNIDLELRYNNKEHIALLSNKDGSIVFAIPLISSFGEYPPLDEIAYNTELVNQLEFKLSENTIDKIRKDIGKIAKVEKESMIDKVSMTVTTDKRLVFNNNEQFSYPIIVGKDEVIPEGLTVKNKEIPKIFKNLKNTEAKFFIVGNQEDKNILIKQDTKLGEYKTLFRGYTI